jgi:nickel-dependent lactate racemase
MKIAFNQQGKARKQMITIISEVLGEKYIYAKTPTYEYRVANFALDKNGTLIFDSATVEEEHLRQVLDALKAEGFEHQDSDALSIGYPLEGFPKRQLQTSTKWW